MSPLRRVTCTSLKAHILVNFSQNTPKTLYPDGGNIIVPPTMAVVSILLQDKKRKSCPVAADERLAPAICQF